MIAAFLGFAGYVASGCLVSVLLGRWTSPPEPTAQAGDLTPEELILLTW